MEELCGLAPLCAIMKGSVCTQDTVCLIVEEKTQKQKHNKAVDIKLEIV